jgi:S1-C subfamily serine protease
MNRTQLSQRQYIIILAAVSAGVLLVGTWLKPSEAPDVSRSPAETSRLSALAERAKLENQTAYMSSLAAGILRSVLWVRETGATGLLWNQEGLMVTAGPRYPVGGAITGVGGAGEFALEPEIVSTSFPFAVVRLEAGAGLVPVQRGSATRLVPGSWILQVSRQPDGGPLFAPGAYSGVASVSCGSVEYRAVQTSIPLTPSSLGAGLFDLDANLLGIVLRCGDGLAALIPEEIDELWAAANSLEGRLLRLYGLRVNLPTEAARELLRATEGIWISETLAGMRADAAGLIPGDVIASLDGKAVSIPGDLTPLLMPAADAVFKLGLRRGVRSIVIDLPGSLTPAAAAEAVDSGIGLAAAQDGYPIESVTPGSVAARAGLMPGDRLLRVDGAEPVNLAAASRALARAADAPAFVVIQRGERKLGVFLE